MDIPSRARSGRRPDKPRASAPPKRSYRRLQPADRRQQILDAAIAYFAEVGFEGATRGLAERLGVTQPLIYRYFPSKEDLIRAVYEKVYVSRWRGEWLDLISRRDLPLRERLISLYTSFADAVFEPDWLRIYLSSGLRGLDINRWWISFVENHLLTKVCEEVRHEYRLPSPDQLPISGREIELYWLFHGGIFYHGLRQHVYGVAPNIRLDEFIGASIDSFLQGFPATLKSQLSGRSPA